jgi:hypothetical protein
VQVLPGKLEMPAQIAVVYLEREFVPPQVRAFVDAVVKWSESEVPEWDLPDARLRDDVPDSAPTRSTRKARPGAPTSRNR